MEEITIKHYALITYDKVYYGMDKGSLYLGEDSRKEHNIIGECYLQDGHVVEKRELDNRGSDYINSVIDLKCVDKIKIWSHKTITDKEKDLFYRKYEYVEKYDEINYDTKGKTHLELRLEHKLEELELDKRKREEISLDNYNKKSLMLLEQTIPLTVTGILEQRCCGEIVKGGIMVNLNKLAVIKDYVLS